MSKIVRHPCPLCGSLFSDSVLYGHVGSVRCLQTVLRTGKFHKPEGAQKLLEAVNRVRKLLGYSPILLPSFMPR